MKTSPFSHRCLDFTHDSLGASVTLDKVSRTWGTMGQVGKGKEVGAGCIVCPFSDTVSTPEEKRGGLK